ncbi:MAG: hypothetical protein JEZ08_01420 [Clostridiales bacterium]|nr:hypothetical protein [Clostridiales bacterium]
MKRFLSLLLVLTVLLSTSVLCFAETKSNGNDVQEAIENVKPIYVKLYNSFSLEEKDKELLRIGESYVEGNILSEKDSAFILLNLEEAKTVRDNAPTTRSGSSSKWYDVYKTQYGVRVNLYGNMEQDIAFIAGSSEFGGSAVLYKSEGSISKVKLEIFHTAYGLIGTSAPFVGVLYNGSVSMEKDHSLSTTRMDKTIEYGSILPVYTTMYARGTVTTQSGDEFTIKSSTWKKFQ